MIWLLLALAFATGYCSGAGVFYPWREQLREARVDRDYWRSQYRLLLNLYEEECQDSANWWRSSYAKASEDAPTTETGGYPGL